MLLQVNVAGVQADAAWTDGSNPDYSYDQVWDSAGRATAQGWMALIAVPFRSTGSVLERGIRFSIGRLWSLLRVLDLRLKKSRSTPASGTRKQAASAGRGTLRPSARLPRNS